MIEIFYLEGSLKKGELKDISKIRKHKLWVDITGITKEEAETIKEEFNLHPLTAEDLINPHVRIKVEEFPDYLFSVFYGIKKEKKIELIDIDFILGKDFIISNHAKEIDSFNELKRNEERLGRLFNRGIDFIFHKLLDMEIDNFGPVLETLDDDIEKIEEEATKNPTSKLLSRILQLKRQVIQIKKVVMPQREKISYLAKNEYKLISTKALPYFRDIYDHSIKVSDTIDNYREAMGSAFDAYMSSVSNNMNQVMKTLSVIATIALPLTVISGIYGTNFDILPGQHIVIGFWLMMFLMLLITVLMLYYFKRKNWF